MERNSELKAIKWLGIISTLVVAALSGLTAAGLFPPEGTAAAVIGALLSVATALGKYAQSRGEKKAGEAVASALKESPKDPS